MQPECPVARTALLVAQKYGLDWRLVRLLYCDRYCHYHCCSRAQKSASPNSSAQRSSGSCDG